MPSLLFAVSTLLACIYRFSLAARHPNGEDNTFIYSFVNAGTVSMFSVFPPLILAMDTFVPLIIDIGAIALGKVSVTAISDNISVGTRFL